MRAGIAAVCVVGCLTVALIGTPAALADPGCNGFFNNSDGSWSPTHPIMIGSPTAQTQLMPSDRLRPGAPGVYGRVGNYLDVHCRLGGNAGRASLIPRSP